MAAESANLPGTIQKLVGGATVLIVGLLIINSLVGVIGTSPDGSVAITGGTVQLSPGGDVNSIRDSTGNAVTMNGSGSVDVSGGIGISGTTWWWGAYTEVDNASRDQVIWSVEDNWILAYNGSQTRYSIWYYNASTTNSYSTSVAAGSPGTLSSVQVVRDGSTVTIYNETDANSSFTITPGSSNSAGVPATQGVNGTLEETRVWSTTPNSTQRQAFRDSPIQPLGVGNRTSRLMLDKSGSSVAVDFRSSSGDLSGDASRGDGLDATTMIEGVDYAIQERAAGAAVVVKTGGDLENMPRLAIDTPRSLIEEIVLLIGSALALGGVALLVIIARRVMVVLNSDAY